MFLFVVIMFLILNHILLFCSLFENLTYTYPSTFVFLVLHVLDIETIFQSLVIIIILSLVTIILVAFGHHT
jgi:hypothetical protein